MNPKLGLNSRIFPALLQDREFIRGILDAIVCQTGGVTCCAFMARWKERGGSTTGIVT
jgi:hypothetical protein